MRDADETGLDAGSLVAAVLAGPDVVATDAGPMSMAHLVPASVRKDLGGASFSGVSKAARREDARTPALYGGAALAAGGGLAWGEGNRRVAVERGKDTAEREFRARTARRAAGKAAQSQTALRGVRSQAGKARAERARYHAFHDAAEPFEVRPGGELFRPGNPDPGARDALVSRLKWVEDQQGRVAPAESRVDRWVRSSRRADAYRDASPMRRMSELRAAPGARRLRTGGRAALATGTVLAGASLLAPKRVEKGVVSATRHAASGFFDRRALRAAGAMLPEGTRLGRGGVARAGRAEVTGRKLGSRVVDVPLLDDGGKKIGGFEAFQSPTKHIFVADGKVAPSHRRQGIASDAMRRAQQGAANADVPSLSFWAASGGGLSGAQTWSQPGARFVPGLGPLGGRQLDEARAAAARRGKSKDLKRVVRRARMGRSTPEEFQAAGEGLRDVPWAGYVRGGGRPFLQRTRYGSAGAAGLYGADRVSERRR